MVGNRLGIIFIDGSIKIFMAFMAVTLFIKKCMWFLWHFSFYDNVYDFYCHVIIYQDLILRMEYNTISLQQVS